MSHPPATEKISNSEFAAENNVGSRFSDERSAELISRFHNFLRVNKSDIFLLIILISLSIINFFIEAKLISLSFFYFVILAAGYTMGERFAVLSAFLTILIVWSFILADKSSYLVHHTNEVLNFYMTLWGGFLILSGWLGSAFAKYTKGDMGEPSQA